MMNPILNLGIEYLTRFYEWGGFPSSHRESHLNSTVSNQIAASKNAELLSLGGQRLEPMLVQRIATYFALQDWGRFSQANKAIHALLTSKSATREICPILYRGLKQLPPNQNVRNLDQLGARRLLNLPEYQEPEPKSIQFLKELCAVDLIAELSENGCSTIITIPKGWTIEKLEALIQSAGLNEEGIALVEMIRYAAECRKALQNSPIEEEHTVAISNSIIRDSRGKRITDQKKLLRDKGFTGELPDALTVLTATVVTYMLTRGNLYGKIESNYTYTVTKQKTINDWHLSVSSSSSPLGVLYLCVEPASREFALDQWVGVGCVQKFNSLGPSKVEDTWLEYLKKHLEKALLKIGIEG